MMPPYKVQVSGIIEPADTLADLRGRMDPLIEGATYLPQFSMYQSAKATARGLTVDLLQVVERMQSQELAKITTEIRNAHAEGQNRRKADLKLKLPVITPAGVFHARNNAGLVLPSFVWQLDIDHGTDNPGEIMRRVIQDEQLTVLLACISTSGRGVKALLQITEAMDMQDTWTWQEARQLYHRITEAMAAYFRTVYGLQIDGHVKALSQPFYLFHALDLYLNPAYT